MSFFIHLIEDDDKDRVSELMRKRWGDQIMVVHDEKFDLTEMPGFVALEKKKIVGLLTYNQNGSSMEILSLDSFKENQGIGSALLSAAIRLAEEKNVARLHLTTTNDNLGALGFYQKRGFTLTALRLEVVNRARKEKPSIPLKSSNGIAIEHEIELGYLFHDCNV
ncbi:GNAT family N-acetyltransferase [Sporolactobacillus pectinivorans]|uniref:GNAT family N-acetyltransferase n=1 Tax=Sporolactobacillus pectinivorans TaxID=1591408 RepID=UPI001EFC78C5|nr:GNAT family N-acetyltransferase [Sporolactobacillus pectinivorans]